MELTKNDFIEIDFTAKIKEGEVFDTTIKEEAKKIGMNEVKPWTIVIGQNMIIQGLDEFLEGKEIGKRYSAEFTPEKAFGKRNPNMVRMIPTKLFLQQQIMPKPGMQLTLDGRLVKVISVSGGRVLIDFNNPLAGKTVIYDLIVNKKLEDLNEKINALQEFFFRKQFEFTINDKEIKLKVPEKFDKFVMLFDKNFQEMLGMKISTEIVKEEKKAEKETEQKAEEKIEENSKEAEVKEQENTNQENQA